LAPKSDSGHARRKVIWRSPHHLFSTPPLRKLSAEVIPEALSDVFHLLSGLFKICSTLTPTIKLSSSNSCDLQAPRPRRYQKPSLSYSLRNPRWTSIIYLQRTSRAPNKSAPHGMAKVIQQLSAAPKTSPMKRLIALLSYLHFATLQVPQHHTHHIGRIVQPQIRSLSAALQGGMLRSPSAKSTGQKSRPGSAQTATP
jgi:hypothetical protein